LATTQLCLLVQTIDANLVAVDILDRVVRAKRPSVAARAATTSLRSNSMKLREWRDFLNLGQAALDRRPFGRADLCRRNPDGVFMMAGWNLYRSDGISSIRLGKGGAGSKSVRKLSPPNDPVVARITGSGRPAFGS
jgi:hypothetical protein